MSEESALEVVAFHHASQVAGMQWQGMAPDEEAMAREEMDAEEEERAEQLNHHRAAVQRLLLVYLFADQDPMRWENVAVRALAVMRYYMPGVLQRRHRVDQDALRRAARPRPGFALMDMVRMIEEHRPGEIVPRVMGYFFPERRKNDPPETEEWLREGCARVYLITRAFQPELVAVAGREMSFEDLAVAFGEIGCDPQEVRERMRAARVARRGLPASAEEIEMDRARSRWSARAQSLIRRKIEAGGGTVQMQFGKPLAAREKYAAAAKGNRNRAGKGRK